MKTYVDLILKKEKKPIDIEKLYQKIEGIIQKENLDFKLSVDDKNEIISLLDSGVQKYEYYLTPNDKYILFSKTSFRRGRFHGNRAGEGFVTCVVSFFDKDGNQIVKEEKYSISKENCNYAVDGDLVLIDIGGNGNLPRINQILERNVGNIIGEVVRLGSQFYVKPIDKKKQSLTIALEGQEYIEGQIVSVSLEEERSANFYIGKVVREFQHKDDPHEDALLEAFKCGMPEGFSEDSIRQLESIPSSVSESDKLGRYDFTDWEVFSIDGADTKDKDDCISLQTLPNGHLLLGVHIADVPYYVSTNSAIHKDAFRKGTSYYFGGCVEPQLPRKLSNGICSLNDGVDRLTKTILIEYDCDGNVVSRSLVPSVIRSRIGMTYDKVNQLLKDGIMDPTYEEYSNTLQLMSFLSLKLREKRIKNGAVEFDRPELKFIYDEDGNAVDVTYRIQDISENLIEEFMLAANVNVGEILTENGIPCLYRVHGVPNQERLEDYLKLLDAIGYSFPFDASEICKDKKILQYLTKYIQKTSYLRNMLSTNLVRCMSHASYNTKNIGHYGTGFDVYCHFTSPIRRLADDTISRIIDECYFEKNLLKRKKAIRKWNVFAQDYANQSSKMERVEEDVEKNVILMDSAVYMSQFLNQEFEGTVISLSNSGLVVQLDNLLEGRVRLRNLPGGYAMNPETFTLLSLDGYDSYYIGDRLRMRLVSADKDNKTIDFSVIEKIRENPIRDSQNSNAFVKMKAREHRMSNSID